MLVEDSRTLFFKESQFVSSCTCPFVFRVAMYWALNRVST